MRNSVADTSSRVIATAKVILASANRSIAEVNHMPSANGIPDES